MRLLLTVVLAGIASFALGVGAAYVVATLLPPYEGAATGGLVQRFRALFVAAQAAGCMLTLGLAARHDERRLFSQMLWATGLPVAIVLLDLVWSPLDRGRLLAFNTFFFAIAVLVPLVIVALTQWLILRGYLRWPEKGLRYSPLRHGRDQAL